MTTRRTLGLVLVAGAALALVGAAALRGGALGAAAALALFAAGAAAGVLAAPRAAPPDVTETKRTQERLRLALTAARMVAWEYDPATGAVLTSDNAAGVFGLPPGEGVGDVGRGFALVHPDDEGRHRAVVAAAVAAGEGYTSQFRIVRPDIGAVQWTEEWGHAVRDRAGQTVRLVGVNMDITRRKAAEDQLRASEGRRRLALDAAELGTWHVDPATMALTTDERFRAIFGVTAGRIDYEAAVAAIHPDDQARVRAAVEAAARPDDPEPYAVEYRVVQPDGSVRWVFAKGRSSYEGAGAARRAVSFDGTVADITERKRAEEALRAGEERFRVAVAATSDILWTNDAAGKMVGPQPGWGGFTGQTFDEYQGYGWSAAIHPDDAQPTIDAWERAVAGRRRFEFEHRVRRRDGAYRLCSIRAVPIVDGGGAVREWVGVHTDVTEPRELERALKDADRRKDEFLATLAHELRNPLAPIRNGLQIIRLSGGGAAAVEQARGMMERQLEQMVRLVDDLLDVSRISRGKLELRKQRVELAAVVGNAVETSRPVIESGGHELTVRLPPGPVYVDADVIRLAQVFANLLNNAAKYSDRGGRITLAAERQGSDAVVSVRDTGVGIPPEMLPKIFDMFTQVDRSLEKAQGGLGIGLTLVRRLAEMHGGSVEARSEGHGKGSEFVVRLPVVLSAAQGGEPPAEPRKPVGPPGRCRVLVADDNEDAATSLAMMLRIMGNEVRTAHDGSQAVDVAAAFRPDVILLDIGMPKLNGYEACRRIRGQPWGERAVLIALTGWGQDEDRRRSQEAGFDHHLVKPVDPQALMNLLAGLRAVEGSA